MEASKFGCFIAKRRKQLNMTQKELALKIQVTDKAVSRWERGLGFPDINTIEDLANALELSITELMKSESKNDEEPLDKTLVNNIVDMAKVDSEEKNKIIIYTFSITTVLFSILEIILGIEFNDKSQAIRFKVPWIAIVPGVLLIVYGIICKIKGKKTMKALEIGVCLLIIPIVIVELVFLIQIVLQ